MESGGISAWLARWPEGGSLSDSAGSKADGEPQLPPAAAGALLGHGKEGP